MSLFARRRAITFGNPPKNKIAILHGDDYWIRTLVLKDMPATTVDVYPARFYLTPALVWRLLVRLRKIDWRRVASRSPIRNLVSEVYSQYVLGCLDYIQATVVLTAVDNSGLFQRLTRIDHTRTYWAIQNGTRTLFCVRDSLPPPPHPASRISMTNLFCFGQRDIDLYARHGHQVDTCVVAGSLVGGHYKSTIAPGHATPRFDLCLISQWHEHFFTGVVANDAADPMARRVAIGINGLMVLIARLLQDTGLTLVVCLRSDHPAEELFYQTHLGNHAVMARPDRANFGSYRIADQSRLAIALNSTMLAELFAWGHKVLWCNVSKDEHYEMPEAGISYFDAANYPEFQARVLALLAMPQAEYEARTSDAARYVNNYDFAHPPHDIIRSAVQRALTRSPIHDTVLLSQHVQ